LPHFSVTLAAQSSLAELLASGVASPSEFIGYEHLSAGSVAVKALLVNGQPVQEAGPGGLVMVVRSGRAE
jgi:hypothetical protein